MTNRDKTILIYLSAVVIVALAYFFGISPMLDKIEAQDAANAKLEMEYRQKLETKENSATFEQGLADFEKEFKSILEKFPNGILEEKSLLFVSDTEFQMPIWLYEVKFAAESEDLKKAIAGEAPAESAPAPTDEELVEGEEPAAEQPAADPNVAEPAQSSQTATSLEGMYGLDYELGLAYKVDYDTFKEFLDYIRNYPEKMVIKNIDGTYNREEHQIEGTIVLSQYAISSPDRQMPKVDDTETPLGTINVFDSGYVPVMDEELVAAIEGSDYFIKLNGVTDNAVGKTIGRAGDIMGMSYLTSNKNAKETVEFTVTGSEGKYKADYKLGDKSFFDVEFEKEEEDRLVLRIVSSDRMDEDDDVSISLRLNNETDRTLYVSIINDDIDNSRIDIEKKNGEIEITQ